VNVSIKDFDVAMEVKNKGFELDIADTNGDHLGDLYVTKTNLIWCKGKTSRKNGTKIKWTDFIEYMESKEK
jgi:hypothetical protein